MPDYSTKRCFVALPLDKAVRDDLAEALARVRVPDLRLVPLENLHVTVKFLGDVEDPSIPEVIEGLKLATEGVGPFELEIGGIEYLPDERHPRMLAATAEAPDPLLELVNGIEDAMEAIGFRREGRPYHAHVTLGRFKRPPKRGAVLPRPELPATGCKVSQIVLMQSTLDPDGAVYTPLAELPLE